MNHATHIGLSFAFSLSLSIVDLIGRIEKGKGERFASLPPTRSSSKFSPGFLREDRTDVENVEVLAGTYAPCGKSYLVSIPLDSE